MVAELVPPVLAPLRALVVADVPANMGGMPLPPISDVIGGMWAFMAPWQPYILLIFTIVLAMGLIGLVLGRITG